MDAGTSRERVSVLIRDENSDILFDIRSDSNTALSLAHKSLLSSFEWSV